MPTTLYCDEADMNRLFSSYGVTAFADHDESGSSDSGVTDDCIIQASQEIDLYCRQQYAAAVLATSDLINRWATVMSVYFLCMRRGNPIPKSIEAEFERIMDLLTKVSTGELVLDLATDGDRRPSFSNLKVDRRYRDARIRVRRSVSTDAPSVYQQDFDNIPPVYE